MTTGHGAAKNVGTRDQQQERDDEVEIAVECDRAQAPDPAVCGRTLAITDPTSEADVATNHHGQHDQQHGIDDRVEPFEGPVGRPARHLVERALADHVDLAEDLVRDRLGVGEDDDGIP